LGDKATLRPVDTKAVDCALTELPDDARNAGADVGDGRFAVLQMHA
jgi:hypothetical protein